MPAGISGRLLSRAFAGTILPSLPGVTEAPPGVEQALERLGETVDGVTGPAFSARSITDSIALPLLRILGLRVIERSEAPDEVQLWVGANGRAVIPVTIRPWADELESARQTMVRRAVTGDSRWCLATNGRLLRILDAHRTWSTHALDVEMALLAHDHELRQFLWSIANADAMTRVPALLDIASALSANFGARVCRLLGDGVVASLGVLFSALRTRQLHHGELRLLEQCLTVIYRILFLLFAEARGLVPVWHPVYRDQYTISAMVSTLLAGRRCRGAWPVVQAIARMAHSGCTAGSLAVTAFNGRLFSPDQTTGLDHERIDDAVMGRVILGVSTTRDPGGGVTRTRYEDLDVEELGAIYERVLEYRPATSSDRSLMRDRETRKETGTFYTPRQLAAALVDATLGPLVKGRCATDILALRILDPAMGSGAFLVASCRFLAARVEEALVEDGTWHAGEVTEADRAGLRREIVQRCLYGVDLNPMAVQLARLSLWLVALAHNKPLSFLDHHLVVGNSLIGASLSDLERDTASMSRRARPDTRTPSLFSDARYTDTIASACVLRRALALEPDDSAAIVRDKERRLASLTRPDATLWRWKRLLDLWCATWFWDTDRPPNRAVIADAAASLAFGRSMLGAEPLAELFAAGDRVADREQFLHWPLVFPEVFQDDDGQTTTDGGFDAVIGNPPWDMVRGDHGDHDARLAGKDQARRLTRFIADAGVYRTPARAHLNRYALFTERALQLVRPAGRLGLVLPGGILSDAGTAPLRVRLLSTTSVDNVIGLDNRAGIFPIHRSTKFALLTATAGAETRAIHCRFGVSRLDDLATDASTGVTISKSLLERVSGGDDLAVPELRSTRDLQLIEAITADVPALADARGWRARFGRELNASDDRALLTSRAENPDGRPVIEGKNVKPFHVALDSCRLALASDAGLRRSIPRVTRLAYREVASATNRLTLIAAIVPANAVTTHTVFCLKSSLAPNAQRVLCTLLNSFVANYLVRMRVSTHVTAAIMSRLRVPLVPPDATAFGELLRMYRSLSESAGEADAHPVFAELQGLVARLYGLASEDFAHVLGTFPLVPLEIRDACLKAFDRRRPSR
jgi:hypothetical protein